MQSHNHSYMYVVIITEELPLSQLEFMYMSSFDCEKTAIGKPLRDKVLRRNVRACTKKYMNRKSC